MKCLFTLTILVALLTTGIDTPPTAAQEKAQAPTIAERLPPKLQQVQKELPAWLQKTGKKEAMTLMQRLGEQVKAKEFEEAETTADTLLKMMGLNKAIKGTTSEKKPAKSNSALPEETTKRLTEKVERVIAGTQKWAAAGRDPSGIAKTMQEKFQPLMQTGKVAEAEAVVDSVLKEIGVDAGSPTVAPVNDPSAEERVLVRIHTIQKELPEWVKKTGKKDDTDKLMQILRTQLADMNFAEAEKTADAILTLMGLSIAPSVQVERPATANEPKHAPDAFGAFFPQQLVFLTSDRTALTPQQREALLAKVHATQPRLNDLMIALELESATLSKLTVQEHVDEAAVLVQLNKLLDVEREMKILQAGQGVAIHNLLTLEQQNILREIIKAPDAVAKLEEEFRNRIMGKIAQVEASAQAWAQSGRDPAFIAQEMEQKVRPLMDSGRVFEAEAEIDRVLAQISKDSK